MIFLFLNNFFNDINLNKEDKFYLLFLFCFGIAITYVMIRFHQTRGAFNSDIFRYLPAALDFAGLNYNHISDPSWMFNSPVIFYLTSILFKLGFVSIKSIFLVTGFFGFLGIFGMYVFLKSRFSPILSFTGAILYSSFSLTLFYFANGMLDTSAVAMILWTFIFVIAAANKNYKYYCLVAISFVICIFVRFTTVYILSLIILYILKDHDPIMLFGFLFKDRSKFKQRLSDFFKSSEFKWMLISVIIAAILISYVFYVLLAFKSQLGYFGMATSSFSHFKGPSTFNYVEDRLFYIKNFLSLLFSEKITSQGMIENFNTASILSYLIFSVVILGFCLKIIELFKNRDFFKSNKKELSYWNKNSKIFFSLSFLILLVISIVSLDYNYLVSLFSIWLIFLIIMSFIKQYPINRNNFVLSIICLGLFVFYLIIFSLMDLKCVRYILPTFPAVVYFVIYSLDVILKFIRNGFDGKEISNSLESENTIRDYVVKAIPLILIIILLFTAFNFTNTVETDPIGVEIDNVSNYLIKHDSNYQNKSIGVKSGEMFYEWYFQKKIDVIDVDNLNSTDNYTYIITWPKLNNENYHELYHSGGTFLYEKI